MRKRIIIIPARGGSKGIPKKNIVKLSGYPLIYYTIKTALEAKIKGLIDEVFVSTDDNEIAEISSFYGAKVPYLRPINLAGDKSKSIDVILHFLNHFEENEGEVDDIILLQPTSPLRDIKDIEMSIEIYENSSSDSLISCYLEEYINDLVMYEKKDDIAIPFNSNHNLGHRRQDLKETYVRNGAIYITNADYIRNEKKIISEKPAIYVMDRFKSINIDTQFDLEMIKWIMSKR